MSTTVTRFLQAYRLRLRLFGGLVGVLLMVLAAALGTAALLRGGRDEIALVQTAREAESLIQQLIRDSTRYIAIAPRSHEDYARDRAVFGRRLRDDLALIDGEIEQLMRYRLQSPPAFAALMTQAERGAFDAHRDALHAHWQALGEHLRERLGDPDEPRLEWGAEAIVARSEMLGEAAAQTSRSAATLVDAHLNRAASVQTLVLALTAALSALLGFSLTLVLHRRFRAILLACEQIAQGRFGYQIPLGGNDEFLSLERAINQLSTRMRGILDLLDALQRVRDPGHALNALGASLGTGGRIEAMALLQRRGTDNHFSVIAQTGRAGLIPNRLRLDLDVEAEAVCLRLPSQDEAFQCTMVSLAQTARDSRVLVLASPIDASLAPESLDLVRSLAPLLSGALHRSLLTEQLLLATVSGLSHLAESRDPETGDHLLRMASYSQMLAEQLGRVGHTEVDGSFIRDIFRFAPMHDIGKVGIPDHILRKPGRLTESERMEMNLHPIIGGQVLRACAAQLPESDRDLFRMAAEIAEGHHERFDGTGYPRGLAGTEIPLSARIVAVADVLDALTTRRPYKQAWPFEQAMQAIRSESGRHFDPMIVEALCAIEGDVRSFHQAQPVID